MRAFVVTGRQPKSVNAERSEPWKRWVKTAYLDMYRKASSLPGELYALVYYFHRAAESLDADNLSKPVLDALTGLAYADDRQVKVRTAGVFDLQRPFGILSLDDAPDPQRHRLLESLASDELHTVYVEIGRLHYGAHFRFGIEVPH